MFTSSKIHRKKKISFMIYNESQMFNITPNYYLLTELDLQKSNSVIDIVCFEFEKEKKTLNVQFKLKLYFSNFFYLLANISVFQTNIKLGP